MARGLALAVALITLVTVGIFATHVWWFPEDISAHGPALDRQFTETFIGTGILFVLAQLGLAFFVWKYRDRGDARKARVLPGGAKWTVVTAFLFVGIEVMVLGMVGQRVWASLYLAGAEPGALQIQVQGEQFAFYFRYPGPDGKFGPVHPEKVDEANENYYGLDREGDADSKDDIVTARLAIPVHRPIELILRAKDVGHSFYVPELRVQQDLVPGMEIPIHFTATKTGRYEIVCTQLCGLGHYNMRAFLEVMPEEAFQKWLREQSSAQ